MKRAVRRFAAALCCFVALTGSPGSAAPRQPNVVVLLADDLGCGDLGCQGNPQIPTPHIDSLASNGMRFTQGYVTAPNCSPSRAGLLTGRIQTRFGYEFNPIGARNEDPSIGLPKDQRTLANVLHDAGYTTALIGKWHLGGTADYHPLRRGFDEFFGFLHEGHFYVRPPWEGVTTMLRRRTLPGGGQGRWSSGRLIYSTHLRSDEPPYDADNPILRSSQPVVEKDYLTDAFTREAIDFIGRNKDKPFYLHLAYNAVHSPLQAPDRYLQRFAQIKDVHRRIFAAMLASLDDSVGAVLMKLREEQLEEHTLVFFLSDNGGPTRELTSSNAPLRGEKGDLYEGGIRVPFIVQWKGRLPAGAIYEKPVSALDILPTVAAAAGAKLPDDLDGVNLLPFLTGRNQGRPHPHLFWRQGGRTALRLGDWKLVTNSGRKTAARWELYDLAEDMGETNDLARQNPARLEELKSAWEKLNAEMREPLF